MRVLGFSFFLSLKNSVWMKTSLFSPNLLGLARDLAGFKLPLLVCFFSWSTCCFLSAKLKRFSSELEVETVLLSLILHGRYSGDRQLDQNMMQVHTWS